MSTKTRAQLKADAITRFPDNDSKEITAEDLRTYLIDILDSFVSKKGDSQISGLLSFSSELSLNDRKNITYKGYVDDSISSIDLSALWNKSGNTLTDRGKFGSTSEAFGWDNYVNNSIVSGVSNAGKHYWGTNGAYTDTDFSFQGSGNTSGTYNTIWKDSGGTNVLARLGNAGLFEVNSIKVFTTEDTGSPDAAVRIARILNSNGNNGHGFADQTDFRESGYSYASFDANVTVNSPGADNYDHVSLFQGRLTHSTNGTTTNIYTVINENSYNLGTVTNGYGLYDEPYVYGTLTNRFGVRVRNTQGTGNVFNNYAFFVDNLTTGIVSNYAFYNNGSANWYMGTGNIGIGGESFGSGVGVMFIANAGTVPSANPTGGGILYVESGALKYRGSSGTITTLASA